MTFKPMLAEALDPKFPLRFPLIASPKIDGIRCVIRGGKALSRSLKPIPNAQLRSFLEHKELEGLDGELILEGGTFQETTSAVMGRSVDPMITAAIQYHVFDFHFEGAPFQVRYSAASTMVAAHRPNWPGIQLVPHILIRDENELAIYESNTLARGYEGVMLRDPNGPYKYGRSTAKEGYLLKLKRFEDAEAEIIGFQQHEINENEPYVNELGRTQRSSSKEGKTKVDALGAFIMRRPDGVEFNCGSGLTDEQRYLYWRQRDKLKGQLGKYKWQPHGTKDKPRSPIFLGLRSELDL